MRKEFLAIFAVSACILVGTAEAQEKGPTIHYTFEDVTNATVRNKAAEGLDGSIYGARVVKSGNGYALKLAGEGDYLVVPDCPATTSDKFTFELWARVEAGGAKLISRSYSASRLSYMLSVHGEGKKFYCLGLDQDGSTEHHANTRLMTILDRWMHLALACDGRYVRLYVNGELETLIPTFDLLTRKPSKIPITPGNPLNIGRRAYLSKWAYSKAEIAEFRAYDRVLAETEIRQHCLEGNAVLPPEVREELAVKHAWTGSTRELKSLRKPLSKGPMLDLVNDGQPAATIIIPATPRYWTEQAAGWLQQYLKKITGAELQVVTEDTAPEGTLISIGQTELAKSEGISVKDLKWAGCKLVVKNGNLFLIGKEVKDAMQDPKKKIADGNCRAVTTFLEDFCGMRWYIPGPKGEFFTPLANLRVPKSLSRKVIPAFAFSDGRFVYGSKGQWLDDITPAAVANNYCRNIASQSGGHTYYHMVPTNPYFREHPEYFAMINGKRTGEGNHLCTTHPEVRKLMLRWMENKFDEGYDVVTIGQEDGYVRCQCPECEKLDNYRGPRPGQGWRSYQEMTLRDNPCERLFLTHKWVIDRLAESRPDGIVLLMGYGPQAWPSRVIDKWGDKVWIEMMNQEPEYMQAWKGKGAAMTSYLYWFNITLDMGPDIDGTPSEIARRIRYLYEQGIRGFYHGLDENFGLNGPTFYMIGRLMGDPYLDHKEIVNEYIEGVYGNAAPAMKKFFNLIWAAHKQRFPMNMHLRKIPRWATTDNIYLLIYSPKTLTALENYLKAAEAAADTEQVKGWVRLSRDYFDFTKLLVEAMRSYRIYKGDESIENRATVKKSVEAFDEWRTKVVSYDLTYAKNWFPHHNQFCNWLTADNQRETKVYYMTWEGRRPEVLRRGVKGMALGYTGGLAGQVSGYCYVREPLTIDFSKDE